ncbi:MAG: hypothetical protein V1744_02125 [Candidatus Altiarchaeota archaeon]
MDHQHGLEYIEAVLGRVGANLKKPVTAYHIGGNAMCALRLKSTTKDTDLVLLTDAEVETFRMALFDSNFMEVEIVNQPEYLGLNAFGIFEERAEGSIHEKIPPRMRIDLFLKQICGKIRFSDEMVSRSRPYKVLGKLDNRICSIEDVFLFKAMAGRPRDIDDMRLILRSDFDWGVVADEFVRQASKLEREDWAFFRQSIASLRTTHSIVPPASFTTKISRLFQ